MAHTITEKKKLLDRTRRIRGQVEAVERALENEEDCFAILRNIAACRGAMNGLMAEVMEGHIRSHLGGKNREQAQAAQELIEVVRSYLK